MLKTFGIAAVLLVGSVAMADGVQVKITSFTMDNPQTSKMGEVCGSVTGLAAVPAGMLVRVTVTTDPNYNPGSYTTLLDQNGNFCTSILTWTGTAQATVWGSTPAVTSEVAHLSPRR